MAQLGPWFRKFPLYFPDVLFHRQEGQKISFITRLPLHGALDARSLPRIQHNQPHSEWHHSIFHLRLLLFL
jgi:hypothetical protein